MDQEIIVCIFATMIRLKYLFVLFLYYCLINNSISQEWHQIYFPTRSSVANSIYETYDKGYIIGGGFYHNGVHGKGMILKTSINGDLLWYKTIGLSNDGITIFDLDNSIDNGIILTGLFKQPGAAYNPLIMKLNICGELDWCNMYYTPNSWPEWGQSIQSIPGGYIALMWVYGQDSLTQRICLYRLDNDGDLVWRQWYAQSDTAIYDPMSVKMTVTEDFQYIINGDCYYPNPGVPIPQYLRPFIVKVDSTGTLDWEIPWALINGEHFKGQSFMSVVDNKGDIYSSGRHIISSGANQGDKPTLLKTSSEGEEVFYSDLIADADLGLTHTINWFQDSTLALGAGWVYTSGGGDSVGVFKTDRAGNVLKKKWILNSTYIFRDGQTTYDNKLVLVGGFWDGIWRTHAVKFNSDLEYDSLYTTPFVYDSLCPYPIPSDTIYPDCVIVGLDDPVMEEPRSRLNVYPNPVSDVLTIEIPELIQTHEETELFSVTTTHYQWDKATLEAYSLHGKLMLKQEVQTKEAVTIDVTDWQEGLYVIRLSYQNGAVGSVKVLVRRF